jgi:hypothetical protein
MCTYRVSLQVPEEIEAEWLSWMVGAHIPDVMKTGCFEGFTVHKVREPAAERSTYEIQYACASLADYERYRSGDAGDLQKAHKERYGDKVTASRTVLEQVKTA